MSWTNKHATSLERQITRLQREEQAETGAEGREVLHECIVALINLRRPLDDAELARKQETGTAGGNPRLAELIMCIEQFPSIPQAVDVDTLNRALVWYEATGDHNHGNGPIKPGGRCAVNLVAGKATSDCFVYKARVLIDRARQATCAACRNQANGIIVACPTHGKVGGAS